MSARDWNEARVPEPRKHELDLMPAGGCRACVMPDDHPVHQGAEVIDLAAARARRMPRA